MPTDFQKAMRAFRKKLDEPSDKGSKKLAEKKSKKVRPQIQPPHLAEKVPDKGKRPSEKSKSSVAEGTTSTAEETSFEVVGKGSKSSTAPKKSKGKEAISEIAVAVEFEDVNIHRG